MNNTSTLIMIGAAALLAGGVATAAYVNNRDQSTATAVTEPLPAAATGTTPAASALEQPVAGSAIDTDGKLGYAEVVAVKPVTRKQQVYATVISSEPVRETMTTTTPHEVCQDVPVTERLPEKDGNVGGTVVGAVVGGLLGNQLGHGNGRKLTTAAGAVAGGFVGNRVDANHQGGKEVTRSERQCHTENTTSESSRVTGYNVTYRNSDGTTGTMRMDDRPGSRIAMGNAEQVDGYDVTYRYQGAERTVRMGSRPQGERLPVVDGQVVLQTAATDAKSAQH
ncbi:MAG: glycine zipper 2TM domain-containing protein [Pseudoxanthomonas sp.]